MKKKYGIILVAIVMLFALLLQGCSSEEKKVAEAAFTNEVTRLTEQFAARDAAVQEAQAIIDSGNKAYVESLIPALETAISNAKAVDITIPEMPSKLEEIKAETEKLQAVDCTESLASLASAKENAELSIQREQLVTAPSEAYVIERLRAVDWVKDISAVTETNDPNGNLNKQGGYTAQVFFSTPYVNQSAVYGDSLIDKGTDAGGSIEVYKTKDEATNREAYLGAFDGGILASGSHKVIGSILVRTSDELTASQQKEFEDKLVRSLIHLDIDNTIANTLVSKEGEAWGVYKDGAIDESYTGIATNNNGQWYVKDGKVDFSFSGEYAYAGLLYSIAGGKVVSDTNQVSSQPLVTNTTESSSSNATGNSNSGTSATQATTATTTVSSTKATTTSVNTTRATAAPSTEAPTTASPTTVINATTVGEA